jgi:uncharacterized RDD family membrane protein YckC
MPPTPDRSDTDVFDSRIGAQIVDLILLAVIFVGLLVLLSVVLAVLLSATGTSESGLADLLSSLMVLGVTLATLSYSAVLETVWNGQTVGKRLFGIRVVSEQGEDIGPLKAVVRNLPVFFSYGLLANLVAILSIASTDRRQRLFDQVASTVVVDAEFDSRADGAATEGGNARETATGTEVSGAGGDPDDSGDADWSDSWDN